MAEAGLALVVMIAVFVAVLVVRMLMSRPEGATDRRLGPVAGESGVGLLTTTPPPAPRPSHGIATRIDDWFDTAVRRSGLDASPAGAVAVMFLLAVALGGGLFLWKETLGLAGLGVVLGIGIPLIAVAYFHRSYRRKLQAQLPDAFRMLAGSVRAGLTLDQAIVFYSERGNPPLAEEFGYTAGLMRLGMSPHAALESTAPRIRLLDFDMLVSTAGLYAQTGGNLVLLLERLADSVRDRNHFQGQFFAATAQARVVAIAIGLAAPLMLLVYLLAEPEHVQTFMESSRGWTLLAGCAVLEVIGILWLWRILKVEY